MQDENCPKCGELLEIEQENVGFQPPDPVHYEVTKVSCPNCGYEE